MASSTIQLPHRARFSDWFTAFLRSELAPYPGRGATVARMVISATLTMIIIVTFRIPGGVVGALCAFILSRENLLSTAKSAISIVAAFVIGGLFVPIGARMFASIPVTHFLWEAVSLFIVFFLLRTLTNFALATGLSIVATNTLSIWYLPGPAQHNVELTLWQVLGTFIGALVTLSVEVVFHAFSKRDELKDGMHDRLKIIESMLRTYGAGKAADPETNRLLSQYAVVGVGALRRYITRANFTSIQRMQSSALISVIGRSMDFAAALANAYPVLDTALERRAALLAEHVAEIRVCMEEQRSPASWEPERDQGAATPLFSELESLLALIPSIYASQTSIDPRMQILEAEQTSNRLFVEDAFSNREHLRYVLGGTLAAMLCYITYVSLDWPGISTAVTTCVLTALTNIGSSRQKQVLRIAGALLGGFVFGLGAQVFVLPYIDSITGFTVLFAVVSAIGAWVATSSARLSYAGLQIVVAFYFINLSEFSIQLSLSASRDRAIGVLLGISMMWLVFERLYPRAASDQMVRIFVRNLRLMATLVTESGIGADADTIVLIRKQRDQVYRYFGEVNAQADAVPFETGPDRAAHMAARDRIRRWQTSLRTFYLMEIPLLQFRLFGDPSRISEAFRNIERSFLEDCSRAINHVADRLESQLDGKPYEHPPHPGLQKFLESLEASEHTPISAQEEGLLRLTKTISALLDRLEAEAASEPLFATE
ncbi:multidrug resistance protein MdtO [Silvibacterium bohemicum]|uniref:Multidrug resistance protein MdtO n=1 Tax=Silvibacterium bohemicum TaxID=1577686 RepID=A0A841JRF1_9BACT|nr:FUSC family protein [Silvibacterium bohemicum]MBB6142359.1 multidrug resistance protein MdtO [Silvibacterium bohemicum]